MTTSKSSLIFTCLCLLCLCVEVLSNASTDHDHERKTYIVYMGELPENTVSLMDEHHSLLSEAIGDETIARNSRLHSFGRSFNGFVARLLPHEAELLSQKDGVVSVFPNEVQKLLTTRSWDFIGLPENAKRNHHIESDTIVAVIDTGIWPESPSFNDEGFGPPPPKWKGKCDKGVNFTGCNNKVIGAQYFDVSRVVPPEYKTPLDIDGHGTHTASTAAGVSVGGANLYGLAKGTARGGVPSARIASYKVCWGIGCEDVNILAAFDKAIADNVDVISLSLGGTPRPFFKDPVSIGSFHAFKRGILTVCAAGNEGPSLNSVQNVAPWIITVAASTIDRKFQTDVRLGNGEIIHGLAVNTFAPKKGLYPLTNGRLAQNITGSSFGNASACDYGTLSENKVKGKIVFCQGPGGDAVISGLGGAGTIMSNSNFQDTAFPIVDPGSYVTIQEGQKIDKYINSTRSARAVIYKSRTVNITAPAIASFSSRGPQILSRRILKPDLAAPGVDIMAAYTKFTTVTGEEGDTRVVKYSVESGTSMACPHVSGAAAYVKSFHPKWSPAAIKSALMTTATEMKIKPVEKELASGSGEIHPTAALDPGLVYDIGIESYISYLCKYGYTNKDVALLTGDKTYSCSCLPRAAGADGLNYPSMYLQVNNTRSHNISAVFHRNVTNVGDGKSIYKAKVVSPKGLSITVRPSVLAFDRPNQMKSFKVILKGKFLKKDSSYLSGSLVWCNSKYKVKSPIFVYRTSV